MTPAVTYCYHHRSRLYFPLYKKPFSEALRYVRKGYDMCNCSNIICDSTPSLLSPKYQISVVMVSCLCAVHLRVCRECPRLELGPSRKALQPTPWRDLRARAGRLQVSTTSLFNLIFQIDVRHKWALFTLRLIVQNTYLQVILRFQ